MRTKITDSRRTVRTETVTTEGGEKPTDEVQSSHVDTRKLFMYFEDGEAPDWQKTRRVYGSSYSTKSREVVETWRPVWVTAGWTRRSDRGVWVADAAMLKSYFIKKDGTVGHREEDTYMWNDDGYKKYLPEVAVQFILDHKPAEFPFALDKEDADV